VESLLKFGISQIYLVDNSPRDCFIAPERALDPARILHYDLFPFQNRGLAEALMLLTAICELPESSPIFKLSGRYTLTAAPPNLQGADVAVKLDDNGRTISTRAYLSRNRDILEQLMKSALCEMFKYPFRVAGPRSLLRLIRNAGFPTRDTYCYYDPPIALEFAAAQALARGSFRVRNVPTLGIEGRLAVTGERIVE
jgi:hypothetical protein